MPFKATWDAAKKKFETESGQKKERAPVFFGVFNTGGSGIGAALDKVEKAKTKKEFDAAWKAYQDTAKKYAQSIDKAIDNLTKTELNEAGLPDAQANATKVKKFCATLFTDIGAALEKAEKAKTRDEFDTAWKNYQDVAKKNVGVLDKLTSTQAPDGFQEVQLNARKVKKAYANLWEALKDIEAEAQENGKKLK